MRSIIFTSGLLFTLGQAFIASGLSAQEGPTPGCYFRVYDEDHLKAHPEQVVSAMRMRVYDDQGYRYAALEVLFANQGHVRRAGQGEQLLDQSLSCFIDNDGDRTCAVDCDGGSFRVVRETNSAMTIETGYLWVGPSEECGGAIDLSEGPGNLTRYRLDRADDAQCGGM